MSPLHPRAAGLPKDLSRQWISRQKGWQKSTALWPSELSGKRMATGEHAGTHPMTIACLGWGSLIWDPRELPIQRRWFDDGPFIKIEFTRQSNDDRITLVIQENAAPVRTLWAVMDTTDLTVAKEALRQREGKPRQEHIAHWTTNEASPSAIPHLAEWANAHGVHGAIWTALPSKYHHEDGRVPTIDEVLDHLRELSGTSRDNAERYIRLAPRQIDTAYRRRIEAEFGWTPLDRWPS